MAGCSLTDEEKRTLADLLTDIESSDDEDTKEKTEEPDNDLNFTMEEDESSESEACTSNAYKMSETEKKRIDDIDNELEKFKLDETDKEKIDRNSLIFRQREWKDVILEHRLSNINAQLIQLQKDYDKEGKAVAEDSPEDEDVDEAVESDANDSACVSDCSESENP